MMTNSSTSPLLQPPPQDLSDMVMLRQWMVNIYTYLYQQTLSGISTDANVAASIATTNTNVTTLTDRVITDEAAITALDASVTTLQATANCVLLNTTTVTNAASIPLPTVFSATYNVYKIIVENLFSVTSAGKVQVQFSTDGSTYDSTNGNYITQTLYAQGLFTIGATLLNTTGIFLNTLANLGTTANTSLTGDFTISNPNTTTGYCKLVGTGVIPRSASTADLETITGAYNQTGTALTGFRLIGSAGNLTGTVSVYGLF